VLAREPASAPSLLGGPKPAAQGTVARKGTRRTYHSNAVPQRCTPCPNIRDSRVRCSDDARRTTIHPLPGSPLSPMFLSFDISFFSAPFSLGSPLG